jgi:hypothetical protein
MTSLEGWGSAIELHPRSAAESKRRTFSLVHGVGATGLEPAIFCSQSRRASRYATPRLSGSAERSRMSVGHTTATTNLVWLGPGRMSVWPARARPVGLPRLSGSHPRTA